MLITHLGMLTTHLETSTTHLDISNNECGYRFAASNKNKCYCKNQIRNNL